MTNVSHKQNPPTEQTIPGKQYSYNEIVAFLDSHWKDHYKDQSLETFKKLDAAFGTISQKLSVILITGSNGKSLTAHFTTRLLKEEGLTVGTIFSPHLLTYNERLVVNDEIISSKAFTDIGTDVLNTAQVLGIELHSLDMITMMGFLLFKQNKVNVAILEVTDMYGADPTTICNPKITAVTRVTDFESTQKGIVLLEKNIAHILRAIPPKSYVLSADQNKHSLQYMQKITKKSHATWGMPIRKLAPLPYPFEQLHGRSAALAERIAHRYVNNFSHQKTDVIACSLLTQKKGHRGRPTLEAKKQAELNPRRTVDQFWKDGVSALPGRFQLLDKEKPTILLDIADNLDSFQNLLLGIRLFHYHRPFKGVSLILGNNNEHLNTLELLKILRYFFKKTSGNIIVCPTQFIPGHHEAPSWDSEKMCNDIKGMKIKAKSAQNFKQAFEMAYKSVDERYGLIIVAGSSSLITQYFHSKGIKKLQ